MVYLTVAVVEQYSRTASYTLTLPCGTGIVVDTVALNFYLRNKSGLAVNLVDRINVSPNGTEITLWKRALFAFFRGKRKKRRRN